MSLGSSLNQSFKSDSSFQNTSPLLISQQGLNLRLKQKPKLLISKSPKTLILFFLILASEVQVK